MVDILKEGCKRFGHKDNYKIAKLYNKNGIQLFNDDLVLLTNQDVVYLAVKGIIHFHYKKKSIILTEIFHY